MKKNLDPRGTGTTTVAPEKKEWSPSKMWPWKVCFVLMMATFLSYIDRNAFSVMAPQIQEEFTWDNQQIGQILSAFFWAYGLMHLFVGFFLDRFNIRFTYGIFVFFWSLSQMLTGLARSFFGLYACRFSLGIFESAAQPGGARIISRIISRQDRTLANSILISGGSIAASFAPIIIITLNSAVGWRVGFVLLGIVGIIWAIFWISWFKPPENILKGTVDGKKEVTVEDSWGKILRNPKFWACIAGAIMVIPIIHIVYSWISIYFVQTWNLKLATDLAVFLLLASLGFEVGLFLTGGIVSFFSRKGFKVGFLRKIMLVVAAICMFSIAFITKAPTPLFAVFLFFVLNLGRAAFGTIFLSFNQEISKARVGFIAGLMGAIGSFSGAGIINIIGNISQGGDFTVTFIIVGTMGLLGCIPFLLINWDTDEE
jgi:MFS transporter, ACS family, hexuronate transporter